MLGRVGPGRDVLGRDVLGRVGLNRDVLGGFVLGGFALARDVVRATRPALDRHHVSAAPPDALSPAWQSALSVVLLLVLLLVWRLVWRLVWLWLSAWRGLSGPSVSLRLHGGLNGWQFAVLVAMDVGLVLRGERRGHDDDEHLTTTSAHDRSSHDRSSHDRSFHASWGTPRLRLDVGVLLKLFSDIRRLAASADARALHGGDH